MVVTYMWLYNSFSQYVLASWLLSHGLVFLLDNFFLTQKICTERALFSV